MISATKKQQILSLRAQGASYATIATEVKIANQTAVDFCKENEETLATLKAMELEAFYESFRVSKEARIEELVLIKNRLKDEIAKRDLADVPTDKLIALYMKAQDAIKDEAIEITFYTSKEQERAAEKREIQQQMADGTYYSDYDEFWEEMDKQDEEYYANKKKAKEDESRIN